LDDIGYKIWVQFEIQFIFHFRHKIMMGQKEVENVTFQLVG